MAILRILVIVSLASASFAIMLVLAACGGATIASPGRRNDAAGRILAAFDGHSIVALAEHHRSVETHAFLAELVSDPRFPGRVDDVIVEFGNSRHQPVLDRFIAGEDVPEAELRQVWRDTTQLLVWDAPMYRQLLVRIRDLNRALAADRRLRVIAGDPPIDWSQVRDGPAYEPFGARDPDTARIIEREVLSRGRCGLLVMGGAHLVARDPLASARGKEDLPSVIQLLERAHPGSSWVVWTVFGERVAAFVGAEAPPAVVAVDGTALGRRSFGELEGGRPVTLLRVVDGRREPYEVRPSDYPPIEDVVDALLYLGPQSTVAQAPPGAYADAAWVEELRRRAAILKAVFGVDFAPDVEEAAERDRGR